MAIQAPKSMDDFMTQASSFVQKARSQGIDDNKIANTIRFMYGLTQDNIKNTESNAITPYQQAQLDLEQKRLDQSAQGEWAYNSDTGQYYNRLTGENKAAPNADTTISSSDFGMITPQPNSSATQNTSFDFDSAANEFTWQQPKTSSTEPIQSTPMQSKLDQTSSKTWEYKDPYQDYVKSIVSGTYGTPWSK